MINPASAAPAAVGRAFTVNTGSAVLALTGYAEDASPTRGPVLLVSGWPQSQLAWRRVVPAIVASKRAVYTVDPRGLGASSTPASGYDLDTVAGDIQSVIRAIAPDGRVDLVGHDLGAWIAHAVASEGTGSLASVALVDAAIPGITAEPTGYPSDHANVRSWHFAFNRLPELPELLLSGHERAFLEWSFRHKSAVPGAIEPAALDEYVRLLRDPDHRRAGFEYYRAVFSDAGRESARWRSARPIDVPLLFVGARHGVGDLLLETFRPVATRREAVLLDCGHYVPEERPVELAAALRRFWG